ncbi:MAG: anhydro-N-acetylmuramic acid kinase [Pelagibacterales bacterium MED-G42]|nr:MAG: anhydro-N-acetylmuramic acid kinase [Pelagibacterales bacterium MED-G42]
MKKNLYTAIGLMSGTSMDGIDASLIKSDGLNEYTNILDDYYKFDNELYQKLIKLRSLIFNEDDLHKYSKDVNQLERELTIFHSKIVNKISEKYQNKIDLIGFHGQTIFHEPNIGVSKQIGDGKLLSQLTKKKVVYDFRQNDLANGGQGAPLVPIFHNLLSKILNKKNKVKYPICFLNIGGISNITITEDNDLKTEKLKAFDIGPGNCLIDLWIKKNSKYKYDDKGQIGKSGTVDSLILNQAIENFSIDSYDKSLDIKNFDISFAKGLSLENGSATITSYTTHLIVKGIEYANKFNKNNKTKYLISGGGRKNNFLIDSIKKNLIDYKNIDIELIDRYNFNGDFIESQAFGYLAIRSFLDLPITFPNTTGCKISVSGGKVIKHF